MNILIIDGQGGNIGHQLIRRLAARFPEAELTAVGTNSLATANMLKAGKVTAATGENPVIVASRSADIIVGPIGIVIADALLGEITPRMALAVSRSQAKRVLVPVNRCDTYVCGVHDLSLSALLDDAMEQIAEIMDIP